MAASDLPELLDELHANLQATEELAIHYKANRWLGEATAVAGDLVDSKPAKPVVITRVRHVRELLEQVGETENPAADERVERALELTDVILRAGSVDADPDE